MLSLSRYLLACKEQTLDQVHEYHTVEETNEIVANEFQAIEYSYGVSRMHHDAINMAVVEYLNLVC